MDTAGGWYWVELAAGSIIFAALGTFIVVRDRMSARGEPWSVTPYLFGGIGIWLQALFLLGMAEQARKITPEEFVWWWKLTWWVVPIAVAIWSTGVFYIILAWFNRPVGMRYWWLVLTILLVMAGLLSYLGTFTDEIFIFSQVGPTRVLGGFPEYETPRGPWWPVYHWYLSLLLWPAFFALLAGARVQWQSGNRGKALWMLAGGQGMVALGAEFAKFAYLHPEWGITESMADVTYVVGAVVVGFAFAIDESRQFGGSLSELVSSFLGAARVAAGCLLGLFVVPLVLPSVLSWEQSLGVAPFVVFAAVIMHGSHELFEGLDRRVDALMERLLVRQQTPRNRNFPEVIVEPERSRPYDIAISPERMRECFPYVWMIIDRTSYNCRIVTDRVDTSVMTFCEEFVLLSHNLPPTSSAQADTIRQRLFYMFDLLLLPGDRECLRSQYVTYEGQLGSDLEAAVRLFEPQRLAATALREANAFIQTWREGANDGGGEGDFGSRARILVNERELQAIVAVLIWSLSRRAMVRHHLYGMMQHLFGIAWYTEIGNGSWTGVRGMLGVVFVTVCLVYEELLRGAVGTGD